MDYVKILIDIVFGYFSLLLLTKLLGKSQLSQITAFDFISALVLGELVGNAMFDDHIGISKILFAMFLWGGLVYITEKITQKVRKSRSFLEGGPSIVIHNGVIDYQSLKKNHLDLNQLQHLLRAKGVFAIQECAFAILETDGTLSVMKKPEVDVVTRKDLHIQPTKPSLAVTLVLDGEMIIDNVKHIGWNEQKLLDELKKQNIQHVRDVLIAEWKEQQPLFVQKHT